MRRLALPVLLLLLLGVAAAWLWSRETSPRTTRNEGAFEPSDAHERVHTGSVPCDTKVRSAPPSNAPSTVQPDAPLAAPEAAKLPEFIDDDPVVATQPLWVPELGPAIARGGARVEFELVDAKGQALEPGTEMGFELWRRVGKHTLREGARLNATRSALICDAYDQGGLEPGSYELTVSCGPYGLMKREFRVSRGESRKERLVTPHWRRIIALCFTDTEGKPLPYLPLPPRYTAPGVSYTVPERVAPPNRVLRAPPEPSRPAVGLGGGRSSSSRSVRPSSPTALRFPTDNGKWYVRVFAGGKGSIRFELDEALFGARVFQVDSEFTEPHWDNYVTAYDVPADFAARMEQRELNGADDPGQRSLLDPPPPAREPDIYDISQLPEGLHRVILSVTAPFPVVPQFWIPSNETPPEDDKPYPRRLINMEGAFHRQLGRWWLDLPATTELQLELVSSQLLRTSTKRESIDLGDSRVFEINRNVDVALLQVGCSSPTLSAMAARIAATCNGINSPEGAAPWQPDGTLRLYVQRGPENFERLGLATSLKLFSGYERRASHTLNVTLNAKQKQELALGGTTVSPTANGLVLRAVGPGMEGLPWVEATLLEFDQDVASKRLRKHWKGSAQEMQECYGLLIKVAAKDVKPDHPDVLRLNELMQKLDDPDSRDWLRREGAWYNTHSRIYSSDHGYLCLDRVLDPKKRYVLYLWSNSRDELMPDKRIDFVATEGITDLGAVLLPAFSE